MKIVCEACQAKYSISDDKVRGKAFKIRCKKCSHIIVVRSGDASTSSGSSPAISTSPPADNSWHIVVDGEQVGPLSASDIRGRLSRGEINGETYIWREGLADWLKVSAIPDFAGSEQGEDDGSSPFPSSPAGSAYPPGTAESAFAAPGGDADVFASPNPSSSSMAADLFASPASSPEPEHKGPSSSSSYASFGAPEPNHRGSGNGAGMATSPAGLTGQRHENSVLFSLSNLEALASPNSPGSAVPRPGVSSGSSEGSGLIDIRSMAAMTLGASTAEPRMSADLPTFGAPQFSPVAPVLLPIGRSGPPRWLYGVLALLVVMAVGFSFMTYKVFFTNRGQVRAPAPPVAPVAAPVAPAPPKAPVATAPPTTPPPSPTEALPPREDKPGSEKVVKATPRGGSRATRAPKGPKTGGSDVQGGVAVAPPASAAPDKPNVGKQDKLDELLSAAMGTKNKPAGGVRPPTDDEPVRKAAPAAAALPTLGKDDIVRAMMGVQSKVKDCFSQYKVPGTAMVSLNVARGGRVTSSSVTGKFAGTPTGTCVAAAVKTAKFPPCEPSDGLAYAFALH